MKDPAMSNETAPGLDDLRSITDHVRFILDAKACAKRADELIGLTIAAQEAQAGAEKADREHAAAVAEREAELAERKAALDARETELVAVEERWQVRMATVQARETAVSEAGQLAEMRKIRSDVMSQENWLRAQLMQIAGLSPRYSSLLNDMPGFSGVIEEILSDHGISADGAPSAGMRIESPTADETIFQNDLPMRTPDVARGKSQRHVAQPRV
jgi:multidrug efflux pump subunit AcrA (membrane-fusion protein)